MAYFSEDLQELKKQTMQKKRMETELKELYDQNAMLVSKVQELEKIRMQEQKDVDRLENGSLAAFFYNVVGKMEEKLTKEKEEAYKAAVKYETAKAELEAVTADIASREAGIRNLSGCEAAYQKAFDAKLAAVRLENTPEAEAVLEVEEKLYRVEREQKEIEEAVLAGKQALRTVNGVIDSLNSADGWAAWDTFGGGGLISDMAKHEHLNEAQAKINTLQLELRNFKTELSDVEIHADIQVQIEDFLRFADYFFDGLFVDWAVKDKIENSIHQAEHTKNEITAVISKLEEKRQNAEVRIEKMKEEREKMILS